MFLHNRSHHTSDINSPGVVSHDWGRTGSEWLLPVLESRPAKIMGSSAPSSSGSATCHDIASLCEVCSKGVPAVGNSWEDSVSCRSGAARRSEC